MSLWVGISPLIGAGSLEGFAVGATVSGAFVLSIAAPRRMRRRQATAATRGVPASASSAETDSVETGALDAGLCGIEAFGAEAERVVQSQRGAQNDQSQPAAEDDASWTSPTGREGRDAPYRSRHRIEDPIPGRAVRGGEPAGRSWRGGASVGRARRGGALAPGAFPGWASRDHAQPDTPFPDVASSDVAFPDGTFRSARQPEVRRLPRHAAPTVSFGTKVSGRVAGLFAAWPLAGGAPS
jgi:hypothetical protein